jgi:methionyl-tRNA formyltransferase
MFDVTIICTDDRHPVLPFLHEWRQAVSDQARVRIVCSRDDADTGDFLFLVSCQEFINAETRARFRHSLVIHASALPQGRGMSPHIWQILEGRTTLTVSLINAEDEIDSGDIWAQQCVAIPANALHDEIHAELFRAELSLMTWALVHCDSHVPSKQSGFPTAYRRRTPGDSELDPSKPLAELFDVIRVADPVRYPAFCHIRGRTFIVTLTPVNPGHTL